MGGQRCFGHLYLHKALSSFLYLEQSMNRLIMSPRAEGPALEHGVKQKLLRQECESMLISHIDRLPWWLDETIGILRWRLRVKDEKFRSGGSALTGHW